MIRYLLDTNVLSEVVRKRPEPKVMETLRDIEPGALWTSVICVTELRFGAKRHPRGERLWRSLEQQVLSRVGILQIGEAEGLRAGELLADLADRGEPIGLEDVLIASTALTNDLVVATRNLRHFQRIEGLRVESWWPR